MHFEQKLHQVREYQTGELTSRYCVQSDYSQMQSTIILKPCIMWKYLTPASHAAATWIDRALCTIIPQCWCYFLKGSVWFLPLFTEWRLCTSSLLPFSEDTVCYRSSFDNQSHCSTVPRPSLPLQVLITRNDSINKRENNNRLNCNKLPLLATLILVVALFHVLGAHRPANNSTPSKFFFSVAGWLAR